MIRLTTAKEFLEQMNEESLVFNGYDYKIYTNGPNYIFYIPGNRKWICSSLEEAKKFGEELFGSQNKQLA